MQFKMFWGNLSLSIHKFIFPASMYYNCSPLDIGWHNPWFLLSLCEFLDTLGEIMSFIYIYNWLAFSHIRWYLYEERYTHLCDIFLN
jgi:hypothetical protein